MKPRPDENRDDGIDSHCQLKECGFCSGNIDLKSGRGPAVPLMRCACHCHRGQGRKIRHA